MKPNLTDSFTTLAAILLLMNPAYADGDRNDKRRQPPPAALDACASAVENDPCSFEGRDGEILTGTCEAPADKPLACRPDRAPREELTELE